MTLFDMEMEHTRHGTVVTVWRFINKRNQN